MLVTFFSTGNAMGQLEQVNFHAATDDAECANRLQRHEQMSWAGNSKTMMAGTRVKRKSTRKNQARENDGGVVRRSNCGTGAGATGRPAVELVLRAIKATTRFTSRNRSRAPESRQRCRCGAELLSHEAKARHGKAKTDVAKVEMAKAGRDRFGSEPVQMWLRRSSAMTLVARVDASSTSIARHFPARASRSLVTNAEAYRTT